MHSQKGGERALLVTPITSSRENHNKYRKVPKFSDARKLGWNLPKIPTKKPNLRVFHQKDVNEIANSGDLDQTAPL